MCARGDGGGRIPRRRSAGSTSTRNRRSLPIALVGYRGSGKTAVGRALARGLGVPFLDTDDLAAAAAGRPIAAVFAREGEAGFRRLERRVLRAALARSRAVVATGGGVVTIPANVRDLRRRALVVYLRAAPSILASRIRKDERRGRVRPSLSGPPAAEEASAVLRSRDPLYRAAARAIVEAGGATPRVVAARILRALRALGELEPGGGRGRVSPRPGRPRRRAGRAGPGRGARDRGP